jgi:hypothetical protein
MTMKTKDEVFREHLSTWLKARGNKRERGKIMRHMVFVTKCHPKSVPRTFKRLQLHDKAHREKRGRPRYYDKAVIAALRSVWEIGDRSCGEVLHPMIPAYITVLERDGQWTHREEATGKLLAMSERTVKRYVAVFRSEQGVRRKGLSGTSPSHMKHIIPIRKAMSSHLSPGDGQLDTVAHCGDSLSGSFVWTLNYTDAATYWTVFAAQWNKGQEATRESMILLRGRLPFPLRALHPDSGSEFINLVMKGWCDTEGILLTRSEPYKKNDNMFVEERNGHVIRKYLGWERLDDHDLLPLVNDLCRVVGLYTNHWKASRRMVRKERIGAKYRRTYEERAMTPYERVLEHTEVSGVAKAKLRAKHETLNPLLLLQEIATLKKKIYELTKASRDRGATP